MNDPSLAVYKIGETFIRRRLRTVGILALIAVSAVLGFHVYRDGAAAFVPACVTLVVVGLVATVVFQKQSRSWQETRLELSDKQVSRQCGSVTQSVPWTEVVRATVVLDFAGNPSQVILASSKHMLGLFGFDQMPEIVQRVKENLPADTTVRTIGAVEQVVSTFGWILGLVLLLAGLKTFGLHALIRRFDLLIPFGGGLLLLLGRPLSNSDPRRRNFEICGGIASLVGAIVLAFQRN